MPERARLAVTLGDPRGIGPEIVAAALRDPRVAAVAELVIIGPRGTEVMVDDPVGEWSVHCQPPVFYIGRTKGESKRGGEVLPVTQGRGSAIFRR